MRWRYLYQKEQMLIAACYGINAVSNATFVNEGYTHIFGTSHWEGMNILSNSTFTNKGPGTGS